MANVDKTKFKSIPVSACQMALAEIDVQQNSDDAKSAPIKLKARSSKPIKHPFWGNVVHDMSGLVLHKTRLAIDYNHDANLIIGYLNKFETSEQDGLVASGALTPNKFNQMAQAVIANLDDGVPYESSINFGGDDLEIEIVGDGETAFVNGYEITGEAVIIRKWQLRGIAVCPYGADSNSSSELFSDSAKTITPKNIYFSNNIGDQEMAIKEEIKDESVEVVEATVEADETKLAEGSETNTESVDAEEVVEETEEEKVEDQDNEPESVDAENVVEETVLSANDPRAELRQFVELFGKEKGSEYYLDGVELSDAKNKYIEELKSENEKLKSVNELGEAEPVSTTKLTNEIKDNFSTVMNSYKTK